MCPPYPIGDHCPTAYALLAHLQGPRSPHELRPRSELGFHIFARSASLPYDLPEPIVS